jgi:hypothetical protein
MVISLIPSSVIGAADLVRAAKAGRWPRPIRQDAMIYALVDGRAALFVG